MLYWLYRTDNYDESLVIEVAVNKISSLPGYLRVFYFGVRI